MKLLLFFLPFVMFGQYSASKATTLSGAAEVITVQGYQAATVKLTKVIAVTGFDVYCSVSCDITLERDGTVATTTALTPVSLNGKLPAPTALAFSASNVGTGTVLGRYTVPAGGTTAVKLDGKIIDTGFENLTIRSASITGDIKINIQWTEK